MDFCQKYPYYFVHSWHHPNTLRNEVSLFRKGSCSQSPNFGMAQTSADIAIFCLESCKLWWGERSKWRRSWNWLRKTKGVYCVAQNMNSVNSVHSQKKVSQFWECPCRILKFGNFGDFPFLAKLRGGIWCQQPCHRMTSSPWDKFHDLQQVCCVCVTWVVNIALPASSVGMPAPCPCLSDAPCLQMSFQHCSGERVTFLCLS